MNYKDIIAQARRLGFQPYAGNESQQQVKVGELEVSPYFEATGQPDLDGGSSQQMGYTISTPMGGNAYRTDVVDLDGNVLRSNVHDAGSDKYGLQDMAKLALAAAGANAGGLLSGAETEAGSALSRAGLSTAPVDSSAAWFNPVVAPDLAASLPSVGAAADAAGTGLLSAAPAADTVQQIVTTGKLGSAPSLLSTVGPGAAAATVAATTLASNPAGSLTDNITPDSVAKTEAGLPKQPGPLDGLKAWAAANPELAKLLFSGGGALLSAAGGPSSSSPGGYVDSGYRPTISREGWNPAPQARQMAAQPTGLLMSPGKGEANSGLWRYAGLLDAGPSASQMTPAMTPPMTPAMTPPRVTPPPMRATPPTTARPAVTPAPTAPAVKPASVTNAATAWKPGGMASWLQTDLTPVQRAVAYNAYRANNMSDAEIRAMAEKTFGKQTDTDWTALQNLAAPLPKDLLPAGKTFTDQQLKAVALPYAQPSAQPPAPPAAQPAADAPIGVPYQSAAQRLKNYVYEGGANDDEATRRGLGYARLMGWSPDEAVRNWNDALGTKFTTDDYQRALQAYGFTSGGLLGG